MSQENTPTGRRTLAKEHTSEEVWHDLWIIYEKGYEYLQEQEKTEIRPERRQVEVYAISMR